MSRWFRMYDQIVNDPKVQRLDGETFKCWVNMLCLASQNGGVLPPAEDMIFALRMSEDAVTTVIGRLLDGGLIDSRSGGANGSHYAPHAWQERQYKSDSSTERVKRFRKRYGNDTETPPETEADTEKNTVAKATAASADSASQFWSAAKAYLGPSKSSLIGKWVKDYGKDATAKAVTEAQLNGAVDPVPYIVRVLKKGSSDDDDLPIC